MSTAQLKHGVEKVVLRVFMNKSVNSVAKPVLKPFIRSIVKRFGDRFAHLPAVGVIPVELPTSQKFYMINNGKDSVANYIYWLGMDEYEYPSTKVWMALAEESEVILDIGAYSGMYSLLAATSNSKARIFAFEPVDETYSILLQNIRANKFKNIEPLNSAVSDSNGMAKLYIPRSLLFPGGSTIVKKIPQQRLVRELEVSSVSIDFFVRQRNVPRVDLVKIDVETAEIAVLRGMRRTMEDHHPTILMEILPHRRKMEKSLEDLFASWGYVWFWLCGDGLIRQKHIKGDPTYRYSNYLFVKDCVERADLLEKLERLHLS